MARFDYKCEVCGWQGERIVSSEDMDNQFCTAEVTEPIPVSICVQDIPSGFTYHKCGAPLTRLCHFDTLSINIPLAFVATTGDPCEPQTDEERRRWDEDGVVSAKGRY
jgi:hypothetical protein